MKTIFICLFLIAGFIKANDLPTLKKDNLDPIPAESSWIKSEVGMWMGNYNVWYKIDKKTSTVKLSYNKRKWVSASDAAWHDNHGRWLFIFENKLMCSDNGKKWIEIPNRTWQDMHGTWYRFDTNWDLWEVKL